MGTFILWFGWFGFNVGSSASISTGELRHVASAAAVSTTLGGAGGCISSMFLAALLHERRTGEVMFDISVALNGVLSGLVSTTAGQ